MRVIAKFEAPSGRMAKVYRDSFWNEYRIKFHRGDEGGIVYLKDADYHTDDKDEALSFADKWVQGAFA